MNCFLNPGLAETLCLYFWNWIRTRSQPYISRLEGSLVSVCWGALSTLACRILEGILGSKKGVCSTSNRKHPDFWVQSWPELLMFQATTWCHCQKWATHYMGWPQILNYLYTMGINRSEDKQAAVPVQGAGTPIIPEPNLCSLDHGYWRGGWGSQIRVIAVEGTLEWAEDWGSG